MAKKKTARTSRWASDAAMQAIVRFGPELSGLKELAREAQEERNTSVAQAHGSAASMMGAIDQARPEVAAIYDKAGLDQAAAAHSVAATDLAGLGAGANAFRAAAGIETGTASRHIAESRAANLSDLSNRRVQARAGEQFAVQAAQQKFASDIGKVLARRQDLGQEKGAFEASTVASLQKDQADRSSREKIASAGNSQSERNSLRSAGIDPDTGKAIPGGKLDPKAKDKGKVSATGAKLVSQDKHLEWQTAIQNIAQTAQRYKGKLTRQQIVKTLATGRAAQTLWVDRRTHAQLTDVEAKNNPNAMKVHLPGISPTAADLKMTAALDVALDGHLSRATQRKLSQAGFRIKGLNLETFGEWKNSGPVSMESYDQRLRRQRRQSGRTAAGLIPASR